MISVIRAWMAPGVVLLAGMVLCDLLPGQEAVPLLNAQTSRDGRSRFLHLLAVESTVRYPVSPTDPIVCRHPVLPGAGRCPSPVLFFGCREGEPLWQPQLSLAVHPDDPPAELVASNWWRLLRAMVREWFGGREAAVPTLRLSQILTVGDAVPVEVEVARALADWSAETDYELALPISGPRLARLLLDAPPAGLVLVLEPAAGAQGLSVDARFGLDSPGRKAVEAFLVACGAGAHG